MVKLCVKKPYTVLVAVIVCLTLAIVSLTRMSMDLLPDMNMPYMVVITTYPGASPEKVEKNVNEPLESNIGTVSNVKNVTSTSAENYSMVMVEFEDETDMDSALVKVNSAIQSANLPDECGTPNVMEISMDMLATQYVTVSSDDKDIYELSKFVDDTVVPYYSRQDGVSTVSTIGSVEKSVEIRLNQDKIDKVNNKVLAKVDKKLADSLEEIEDAQADLDEAKDKLEDGEDELEDKQDETSDKLGDATLGLNTALSTKSAYEAELATEKANQTALQTELKAYEDANIEANYNKINEMFKTLKSSVTGDDAYKAAYEQIYNQILISSVQEIVNSKSSGTATDPADKGDTSTPSDADKTDASKASVTVTSDNVQDILKSLGSDTADSITKSVTTMAETTTKSTLEEQAAKYPDSIEDAIKNPAKLSAAVELMKANGQSEAAASLTADSLQQMSTIVNTRIPSINTELSNLKTKIAVSQSIVDNVTKAVKKAMESYSTVEASKILAAAGFGSAEAQIASSKTSIETGQEQLDSALESYEDAKETALKNANIDSLLDKSTLSSMIYAQNFSMPAGYIDDKDDNQWMLKIGNNFNSVDEIQDMLLCNIDGVGDVRISDVADVTVIDNSDDSYSKVNGSNAVVLSIYKSSTSSTSDVSQVCNQAASELEEKYSDIHITPLMDQGQYISIILGNILHSMVLGAILAIVILALFLQDVLPTIVVAFSIPFSVLIAILLLYFSGISFNIMSLAGLALGIGMLVDNSIVVIENIYRLRNRGLSRARAAVQGSRQVQGAIIASTLTTICVFLPMIFTTGTVRQLMLPFALTIGYSLMASLIVALTVVPTFSSVVLRKQKIAKPGLFEKIQDGYAYIMRFCLRVKLVPLGIAIALLAVSILGIINMGIVMIPDVKSEQINVSVTLDDEDISKEDSFAKADELLTQMLTVQNVETVGVISSGTSTSSLLSSAASDDYSSYTFYIIPSENVTKEKQVTQICNDLETVSNSVDGVDVTVSASAMGSMSSMLGSGLSINIYGDDVDTLLQISKDFENIISQVEGFTDVSNGQEDADPSLHLVIDRDKAMRLGLTTAQIFSQISGELSTDTTAITATIGDEDMDVVIVDETSLPTKEKLLDETFETTTTNDDGESETEEHKLSEFAELEETEGVSSISRENNVRYITVTATTMDGYNTTKLSQGLISQLDNYDMPEGYSYEMSGEYETVSKMVVQMLEMLALGFLFVYLVMVAQFQSLLSPFIVMFTVPLAFTGGFFGLLIMGQQLSMMALMGFLVLMGTVVNNGIVFVDYANQLRLGGMEKHDALIMTGKTRMRPILMTALTTILSMGAMVFDTSSTSAMGKAMATVVAGGLLYATFMTLFIVPVMYDILYRGQPKEVDVGSDDLDDVPDDAAEFIAQLKNTE